MSALAINDGLAPIRNRFLVMLRHTQIDIQSELERALDKPHEAEDALQRIQAILHKIAGTAGTLGFEALGERARASEDLIIDTTKHRARPRAEAYMQVIGFLEYCLDLVDEDALERLKTTA